MTVTTTDGAPDIANPQAVGTAAGASINRNWYQPHHLQLDSIGGAFDGCFMRATVDSGADELLEEEFSFTPEIDVVGLSEAVPVWVFADEAKGSDPTHTLTLVAAGLSPPAKCRTMIFPNP